MAPIQEIRKALASLVITMLRSAPLKAPFQIKLWIGPQQYASRYLPGLYERRSCPNPKNKLHLQRKSSSYQIHLGECTVVQHLFRQRPPRLNRYAGTKYGSVGL